MTRLSEPTALGDEIADEVRRWYEANRETWWHRLWRRPECADEFILGLVNEVSRILKHASLKSQLAATEAEKAGWLFRVVEMDKQIHSAEERGEARGIERAAQVAFDHLVKFAQDQCNDNAMHEVVAAYEQAASIVRIAIRALFAAAKDTGT